MSRYVTAWLRAERAWYQTSPFGSPVRSIIFATSLTCQKIWPSSTSSTLSDVRTVYSKKAYLPKKATPHFFPLRKGLPRQGVEGGGRRARSGPLP